MAKMSDYLEVELRKHIFRTGSFTKPIVLAVSLHTADPLDDGTGAEVSGGGYARQDLPPLDANWTGLSLTDGLADNAVEINFGTATAPWGTVTHFGIWDALTLGNLLVHGVLTVSKTINSGDSAKFAIGALDVTFS